MARHCDDECGILHYVPDRRDCPILSMKQQRKEGDWWIEIDGDRLAPRCENKIVRVSKKKVKILT